MRKSAGNEIAYILQQKISVWIVDLLILLSLEYCLSFVDPQVLLDDSPREHRASTTSALDSRADIWIVSFSYIWTGIAGAGAGFR